MGKPVSQDKDLGSNTLIEQPSIILGQSVDPSELERIVASVDAAQQLPTSWIVDLICPFCGRVCQGNLPPKPESKYSESDAACLHCKGRFTIRRYNDGAITARRPEATPRGISRSSKGRRQVALMSLGATLPATLNINQVARRLSRAQGIFEFVFNDEIPILGEPDELPNSYSGDRLLSVLPKEVEYAYVVGITNAQMEGSSSALALRLQKQPNIVPIVLSISDSPRICHDARRSQEDYLAMSIARSIIYATYWEARARLGNLNWKRTPSILPQFEEYDDGLFHKILRGCVFDIPYNHVAISYALTQCRLCESCHAKLMESSVRTSHLDAVERILKRVRTPTILQSFLSVLNNPVLSFVFGGLVVSLLINLVSASIEGLEPYVIPSLLALAAALVIVKHIYDVRRSRT